MKYKREILMKIDVPWPFLSESKARFFTPLYQFYYKDDNTECQNLSNFLIAVFEKFIVNV